MDAQQGTLHDALKPGVVLWRDVKFGPSYEPELAYGGKYEFVQTERGSWKAKLNVPGTFSFEPSVSPCEFDFRTAGLGPVKLRGIFMFVEGRPDDNWTHLIVTHNTIQPEARKGVVFAQPVKPMPMDAYLRFRQDYALGIRSLFGSSIADKADAILRKAVPEQELGKGVVRLVIGKAKVERDPTFGHPVPVRFPYEFCYLEQSSGGLADHAHHWQVP